MKNILYFKGYSDVFPMSISSYHTHILSPQFVIAALVAVAAAGRLEHLERSYLPPDNSIGVGRSSFGSNGGFGSPSSHGSFGANSGGFGSAGAGLNRYSGSGNFAGATSNQYLPPNHGSSASNGGSQFGGSLHGKSHQIYKVIICIYTTTFQKNNFR